MMKKRILFAVCSVICLLLLGSMQLRPYFQKTEYTRITMNGNYIPFVRQGEETYIYLKDLLEYGFCLDVLEGGISYQKIGEEYYFVLWTDNLHDIEKSDTPQLLEIHPDMKNRIYINGLNISTYALSKEPMICVAELSDSVLGGHSFLEEETDISALYYDVHGKKRILQEKVQLITEKNGLTLDGNFEPSDKFQFKNCSPYFVQTERKKKGEPVMALHTMQKGEILKTAKGEFPLLEIFAGDLGGVKLITMTDNYTDFSSVLNNLNLHYTMKNGILVIEGDGNRTSCETDRPEAIQSLPYYHERIIKTSLKNEECQTLECLYTGNTLYLRREDVETKDLLKKNGYFYQEYTWYPD